MDMMGYHDILHQMVTFWGLSTVSTVSTNLPGHQWWTGGANKSSPTPNQHQIYTCLIKERPPKWTDPIPSLPVEFLLCCLKTQGKHCYRNDRNDFFCSLAAFIRIFSCCWAVWDRAKHGPDNDQKPCSLSESFTPSCKLTWTVRTTKCCKSHRKWQVRTQKCCKYYWNGSFQLQMLKFHQNAAISMEN